MPPILRANRPIPAGWRVHLRIPGTVQLHGHARVSGGTDLHDHAGTEHLRSTVSVTVARLPPGDPGRSVVSLFLRQPWQRGGPVQRANTFGSGSSAAAPTTMR